MSSDYAEALRLLTCAVERIHLSLNYSSSRDLPDSEVFAISEKLNGVHNILQNSTDEDA